LRRGLCRSFGASPEAVHLFQCSPAFYAARYAILDDVLPVSILANEKLAALTERLVFSVSSAAVVTAAVYEPHHIRGIVRSIARLLTKHWHAEVGL